MSFAITDMQAQLQFGGARPSLFRVQITNPVDPRGALKQPFMIMASSIPASIVGDIPVPYFGRQIHVAGVRTFEPWTVNVINDEDFAVRRGFEAWNNQINTYITNTRGTGTSAPASYKGQGQVVQMSQTGEDLQTYNFVGLIPLHVGAIELNWQSGDQIEMFTVQFVLDAFTIGGEQE